MKKSYLIVVGIIVVVGVGAGAYLVSNKNNDDPAVTNSSSSQQSSTSTFNPINSSDQPFVATIKTDGSTGVMNSTLEHGKGSVWHMTAAVDGKTVDTIYTNDAYYMKMNGQWYKSSKPVTFDKDTYSMSSKELADFQAVVKYKGQASCPAGTCDLWEADNYKGSEKLSFYVDSSNKINQLVTKNDGKTITVTYTYKPVTVVIPANAKTIPGLMSHD